MLTECIPKSSRRWVDQNAISPPVSTPAFNENGRIPYFHLRILGLEMQEKHVMGIRGFVGQASLQHSELDFVNALWPRSFNVKSTPKRRVQKKHKELMS